MNIIDKIEIKSFRSFLGSPQEYSSEIYNLKDLNIFSGANDSGKSNILRALNLFFNDEIAPGVPFNFDRDFFIGKQDRIQKVIEIAITFNLPKKDQKDFLPQNFTISKFYNRWGFRNYIYSFTLKSKGNQEIKIDSRSENNNEIYKLFLPKDFDKLDKFNILCIFLIALDLIIFTYFSYNPLKVDLFKDPTNNTYGIKK